MHFFWKQKLKKFHVHKSQNDFDMSCSQLFLKTMLVHWLTKAEKSEKSEKVDFMLAKAMIFLRQFTVILRPESENEITLCDQ